ncbi:lysozyme inhibitor LprI family protein [Bacillus sp. B1-b2]|uniref:lysozyme inhibitor LprI family protein n=1 Tax=Bacillus sp. B1-b2 TaxID=2653201 RepID=UPI001261C588|nr:lysozyme inhibitor LprI family protein [Bacillus sp. B1-b2]KAB7665604.1 DUF1311 domain-containing protein [Bacillus sp. B1-b2]
MMRKVFFIVTLFTIMMLAACGNSSDDESVTSSENDATTTTEDTSDTTSEDTTSPESTSENDDTDTASMKTEYLEKLNTMKAEIQEQIDNSKATTTVELMKEAEDRYEAWDQELNNIYSVIQEQLPEDERAILTDEQRNWIVERDNAAKEASLKFEGGTAENLEYTAALANEQKNVALSLWRNIWSRLLVIVNILAEK